MKIVFEAKAETFNRASPEGKVLMSFESVGTVEVSPQKACDPKAKKSALQGHFTLSPIFAEKVRWGSKLRITIDVEGESEGEDVPAPAPAPASTIPGTSQMVGAVLSGKKYLTKCPSTLWEGYGGSKGFRSQGRGRDPIGFLLPNKPVWILGDAAIDGYVFASSSYVHAHEDGSDAPFLAAGWVWLADLIPGPTDEFDRGH